MSTLSSLERTEGSRGRRWQTRRQQGPEQPREHVTGTGRREPRWCIGLAEGRALGVDDEGRRPLEEHRCPGLPGQLASPPQRVSLNLDAIRDNVAALRRSAGPAEVLAVVKADAYGHGLVPSARAALAACTPRRERQEVPLVDLNVP